MSGRWGGRGAMDKAPVRDASPSQLKEQARKLVTDLLYAKRNGNIKKEQAAHEKLVRWSQANNVNMENVISGVTRELGTSVAAIMNSLM